MISTSLLQIMKGTAMIPIIAANPSRQDSLCEKLSMLFCRNLQNTKVYFGNGEQASSYFIGVIEGKQRPHIWYLGQAM